MTGADSAFAEGLFHRITIRALIECLVDSGALDLERFTRVVGSICTGLSSLHEEVPASQTEVAMLVEEKVLHLLEELSDRPGRRQGSPA